MFSDLTEELNDLYLLSSGSVVLFVVEFFEQEEEHNGVHSNPPDECSRIIAVDEE